MQRQLHWFWRAAIAVAAGCLYGGVTVTWFNRAIQRMCDAILRHLSSRPGVRPDWRFGVAVVVAYILPTLLLAFATYGVMTRLFAAKPASETETRCRYCHYILRGITEPRCPECGERI